MKLTSFAFKYVVAQFIAAALILYLPPLQGILVNSGICESYEFSESNCTLFLGVPIVLVIILGSTALIDIILETVMHIKGDKQSF